MDNKVYIKISKQNKVSKPDIYFKDIFKIYSSDKNLAGKVSKLKLVSMKKPQRQVFDSLKVVSMISGVDQNASVIIMGEYDFIVEYSPKKEKSSNVLSGIKIAAICILSMVGAGYGIIAYNNDVGTIDIFARLYDTFGAGSLADSNIIEISYAVGLFVGIILFFDHFLGHRISKSPTPVEVAMNQYESDTEDTVIAGKGRGSATNSQEGK